MEPKASLRFRIIVIVLTVLMMTFAFVHSAMPASVSADESAGVLDFIYHIFMSLGITAELTDHIIRKLAHFSEFSVMGALLMTCAYAFSRLRPIRYLFQVLFAGLAAAVCDETIQLFSEGRSGQITDVLLDFSGVVTGALCMLAFFAVYRHIRFKKQGDLYGRNNTN